MLTDATLPLTIRKLATCEDNGLQQTLAALAELDPLARDYLVAGLPELDSAEDWARLDADVTRLVREHDALADADLEDADNRLAVLGAHRQWSYLLGLLVGLRLGAGVR